MNKKQSNGLIDIFKLIALFIILTSTQLLFLLLNTDYLP